MCLPPFRSLPSLHLFTLVIGCVLEDRLLATSLLLRQVSVSKHAILGGELLICTLRLSLEPNLGQHKPSSKLQRIN
jgi:hypothetical protein